MIKKCLGCGVILQDKEKKDIGYTPNINNTYCMRCFRLKNYGEKTDDVINDEDILKKVNKQVGLVFFMIDYLNLNYYTLDIFNKIKNKKILIISKSDTLRKEMKYEKIKLWLRQIYKLDDEIMFLSSKSNKMLNIFKKMDEYNFKSCFIMGITNAGKSTFINKILKSYDIKKEIVVSDKPNTTLDFIKLRINDYIVYDTPGFNYLNLDNKIINSEIKMITYNIKGNTTLIINDTYQFYFRSDNIIVIYGLDNKIKRVYKKDIKDGYKYKILANHDLVIPGFGFINIKQESDVITNLDGLEVRRNISGVDYE